MESSEKTPGGPVACHYPPSSSKARLAAGFCAYYQWLGTSLLVSIFS